MAEKILNARLTLKYDSYEKWQNSSLILKAGEIAIATIPQGTTADGIVKPPAVVAKVGNGSSTFAQLPWLQGPASDVYEWAKATTKPTYSADEITGLDAFIAGEIEDTDTQYKVEPVAGSEYKFNLLSKGKGDTEFKTVVSELDLSAVGERLGALEDKVGASSVASQIADNNASLKFEGVTAAAGQVVKSVSQANGVVSAELKTLEVADIPELPQSKVTGLETALAGKQATVEFDGEYSSTNKAATVSTVSGAIAALKAEEVAAGSGEIISKVSQTNGAISVEKRALTKADIPTIDQNQVNGLEAALESKQDNLGFTGSYNKDTNPVALKDYVDNVMADVNGAMHFRGAVTGDTFAAAIAASGLTFEAGDVVLWGVEEYVYDGTDWHVLGNESIYAIKSDVNTKFSEVEAAHKTDIDDLKANKQDNISFDGDYNATSNKAATVSTVSTAISNNNAALKYEDAAVANQFVTAVTQTNGVVEVSRRQAAIADISGLQTAINGLQDGIDSKQDTVSFDGAYGTDNKAATVSTVTDAIAGLKNEDAEVANQVVVEAKQTNGVVNVVRKALAAIAWSGSTDDLVQGENTLVINCGTSDSVI